VDFAPVLVADGDRAFRSAVAKLVRHAGLTASAVGTGDEAIAHARASRPSAVILDVGLQAISGYETCRELREMFGETLPILFVSAQRTEPGDRVAGLLLGADDYLAKPVDPDELLARIRRAVIRSARPSSDANGSEGEHRSDPGGEWPGWGTGLTARELEVLRLIAIGQTPREISERLVISSKTVSSHIQHILAKLGVHNRLQAVALAYKHGLVTPDRQASIRTASR
jgi:two-component system, NarL family, nitrate/nitrite response regulator NarL